MVETISDEKMIRVSSENQKWLYVLKAQHGFPSADAAFQHVRKTYEKFMREKEKALKEKEDLKEKEAVKP